ncbi:MAG TPA: hypothetical protein VMT58_00225 [Candidatus Binataceae bacterium]|nr:hypothetical protein [Candidatus Binataceae bacterium]
MSRSFGVFGASAAAPVREPGAAVVREVDRVAARLLDDINVAPASSNLRPSGEFSDLKNVLCTDYLHSAALPPKSLLMELARIVDAEVKPHTDLWRSLANRPGMLGSCGDLFRPREIELRAEPYRVGAGLALRGFFCRAPRGGKSKFVIFVNTAHHPGAVAAALGHELGHYIYGSLTGEQAPMTALMDGMLASHLRDQDELFADSVVALSAYTRDAIEKIGAVTRVTPGSSGEMIERFRSARATVASAFNIDLSQEEISAGWRVRYLTSITHFFKLRCALYHSAGL